MRLVGSKKRKYLLRKQLRQGLLKIRGALRREKSQRIMARLLRSTYFKKAKTLLTYVAHPTEVETRTLIQSAFRLHKTVCAPRVDSRTRKIQVYEIKNLRNDLRLGAFGIREPKKRRGCLTDPQALDLIVVPGLGFDRHGGRIGRGGGYFDRFLKKATHAKKVGLAFREQLVKKVPMSRQDVRMDWVITD